MTRSALTFVIALAAAVGCAHSSQASGGEVAPADTTTRTGGATGAVTGQYGDTVHVRTDTSMNRDTTMMRRDTSMLKRDTSMMKRDTTKRDTVP
jgi:hypothetical protein